MAMQLPSSAGDEDELNASINTTPLVDVMLVLLIIFLITIPVVTHTVPVRLPRAKDKPLVTKPQNITISVTRDGDIYWGEDKVDGSASLLRRLVAQARMRPQPRIEIRGDQSARYEYVGKIVYLCEKAGLTGVSFIIQPPSR